MKTLTNVILKNAKRKEEKYGATTKEKWLSVLAFGIVFIFLAVVMIIVSIVVTRKLDKISQTYSFVNLLLLMNFFILFTKSIFESLNVLYFSKDLKLLLRMPLKAKDILHAKLFNMIISEYPMEIIMLAIPMVVYGIYTKVNLLFYVYMVCVLLILPIIPIMLTSLVISIIMRFTNKIKNKSKVMYVTIIITILLMGIVTASFNSGTELSTSGFENMILKSNALAENIANYFVLIKPIMNTLLNYNNIDGLKNLGIYFIESIVIYIIILYAMSTIYFKGAIGTTVNSNRNKANINKKLDLKDFKVTNKKKAYIKKELRTMMRTPIFFIECLLMPTSYPIAVFLIMAFFINFANQIGVDILSGFYKSLVKTSGLAMFLSIGQVFFMMNFSSIIAISRESHNSILVKYLPIALKTQFNLKLRIGIFTNTISSIIVAICYYICVPNATNAVLIFIILMFLNIIGEKFKLLTDLRNPQVNWESEYTMMKQNTNVMYALFYTLIIIAILAAISFIIVNIELFLIFVLSATIVINMCLNEYIHKNQMQLFKKVF